MLEAVRAGIKEACIAEEVKLRLQPCLKWLTEALDGCAPVAALTFAVAAAGD